MYMLNSRLFCISNCASLNILLQRFRKMFLKKRSINIIINNINAYIINKKPVL